MKRTAEVVLVGLSAAAAVYGRFALALLFMTAAYLVAYQGPLWLRSK